MIFSFFKCCRCQASWEGQREAVSAWWQGEEVTLCKACVQYHFTPCQRMKIRMSVLLKQHNFIIFTINCILSSENLYVKAILVSTTYIILLAWSHLSHALFFFIGCGHEWTFDWIKSFQSAGMRAGSYIIMHLIRPQLFKSWIVLSIRAWLFQRWIALSTG